MEFFGQLEKWMAELYPYRYPLSAVMLVAIGTALFAAYRFDIHRALWRQKYWTAGIGVPVLVVTLFVGNYLLSPLWTRTTLVEESPLAAAEQRESESTPGGTATVSTPASPATSEADAMMPTDDGTAEPSADSTATPTVVFEPRVVQEGEWRGADEFHFAEGRALIIETEPGIYVLRVEDFSVRNGPDLFVLLSADADGYSSDNLNLGELRATDGAFNYDIPPDTDISQFKSVVVWCEAFSVLFGTATLM